MTEPRAEGATGIRLGQIFLASVNFTHRPDFLQVSPRTDIGEIGVDVTIEILRAEEGKKGLIRYIVQTRDDQDPVYRFRVEMLGLVERTEPQANPQEFLVKSGAFVLYPFVREAVANLTARGRFGPIWLKPLNFVALAKQGKEAVAQIAAEMKTPNEAD